MNCANHPEISASAFCQFCGKPLCKDCVRSVGGVIYCESCLAARVGAAAPANPGFGAIPGIPMQPQPGPNPALAGLLGVIPGVGAMYNGQLVKGLAHVLIFAILVSLSHSAGIFGLFIAAWVIYQIFDAFHTAKARRDGLPLPDPFGLNDLGHRLGLYPNPSVAPGVPTGVPPRVQPADPGVNPASSTYQPTSNPAAGPAGAPASGFVPPAAAPYTYTYTAEEAYSGAPAASFAYDPATAPVPPRGGSDLPTGAIILIAFGVLFLLGTLGIFNGDWVERGWPLVIIGIGVWLFVRRSREVNARQNPPTGGPTAGGGLR